MKACQAINAIDDSFYTVSVVFKDQFNEQGDYDESEKKYTYKVDKNIKVDVGDYVVVIPRNRVRVVMVVEVHDEIQIDFDSDIKYGWVVQRVDFSEYNQKIELEEELQKRMKKAEVKRTREVARQFAEEEFGKDFITDAKKLIGSDK